MSTVSKAIFDPLVADATAAHARLVAFLSKAHPGEPEAQAIIEESQKALAGLQAASVDVPSLLAEIAGISVDVAKVAADILAKNPGAIADVVKLLVDLKAASVTAMDALAKFNAGEAAA